MRSTAALVACFALSVAVSACAVGISPDFQDASADSGFAEADAGADGASGTACPGYAAPSETAMCKCGSGKTCDANSCYGGYYCALGTMKCVPKPASCP